MALFFIGIALILRYLVFIPAAGAGSGIFGGPMPVAERMPSDPLSTLLLGNSPHFTDAGAFRTGVSSEANLALLTDPGASSVSNSLGQGLIRYKVQKGDRLDGLAKRFGISMDTIRNANPDIKAAALRPGDELVILPVSGILHTIKEGETLEGLAANYNLTLGQLRDFNPGVNLADLGPGMPVVIPGAKAEVYAGTPVAELKDLKGYFKMPTEGFNWGKAHNYNAVDIANSCGTPVDAAAEGLVSDYGSPLYSNGGYGGFVMIEHPNGTKTRYAHLNNIYVELGDYVGQGDKIGAMGATGNVHGPTGCHLHFEVYGAKNPFIKI